MKGAVRSHLNRCVTVVAAVSLAFAGTSCVTGAKAAGALRSQKAIDAQVRPKGKDWQRLESGRTLAPGDQVRTGSKGSVRLASGGTSFELAPIAQVAIVATDSLTVLGGDVLATGDDAVELVDAQGSSARAEKAAFRLDSGERVAVYRGNVHTVLPVGPVDVPPGREVTLGLASIDVKAVTIVPSDTWDHRLFEDAIQIDRQLAPYGRSFDVNTTGGLTMDFLARYVRRDAIGFVEPLLPVRLRAIGKFDLLAIMFIAIERAGAQNEKLEDAFSEVVTFRDEGASLGLVAQVLDVKPAALIRRVITAFTPNAPPQSPEPPDPTKPGPSRKPTPLTSTSSNPTPHPTPTDTETPEPTPTPDESPSPLPSPSPSCDVVSQITGACTPLVLR